MMGIITLEDVIEKLIQDEKPEGKSNDRYENTALMIQNSHG